MAQGVGIDMQKGLPGLPEGLVEPAEVVGRGIYLVAGGIALVLAAGLIFLSLRWVRQMVAARKVRLSPKKVVEEGLRGLQREAGQVSAAELALRLSALLRSHVDRLWQTQLSQQTWHEHWSADGSGLAALPQAQGEVLAQLLADCNALKFEPLEITQADKEALLRRAREWVATFPSRSEVVRTEAPVPVSR